MPKGHKTQKTIEKEEARSILRQIILARMGPMTDAQIDNAMGIKHFMLRQPDGKFKRLEDPREIIDALNAEDDEKRPFWIYTKDPSTGAYTDLMNRALDKPKEQEQEIKLSGEVTLIELLLAGRKRAADAKKKP